MARLTRTQKYADLREQLANDKEEIIASRDLSSYQDRFNAVQETLAPASVEKQEEAPADIWQPFEPVNQEVAQENNFEPIQEEEIEEAPAFVETPVEEAPAFVETPVVEEQVEEVPAFELPAFEKPAFESPVFEQPVQEETKVEPFPTFEEDKAKENGSAYFDSFMSQPVQNEEKITDFNSFFEDKQEVPVSEEISSVFEDVKDDSGEIISQKERDSYLNQTLSDVDAFNAINGENTIKTTLDNLVDEVRHPEGKPEVAEEIEVVEPADNTYAWTPFTEQELDADKLDEQVMDDEEFSNTVSLEISKIMDEVANAPKQEVKFEEVKPEEEVIPEVQEEKVEEVEETIQIEEVVPEEKPEEVVEIKNIAEIENEPAKDTMSSTIPFVVAEEDEEVLDDEDEDGSNTVLNVILIVLIVVLVAVLGLIVFYILKTKGFFN